MTRSVYDNGSWECHMFIKNGDQVALEKHLSSTNFNTNIRFQNETLLTTAVKAGFPQIVQILLSNGADSNLTSSENGRNEPPLLTAIRCKSLEIVTVLIERGADINRTSFYGSDAILQAVVENAYDILGYLLMKSNYRKYRHESRNCPFLTALKYSQRFAGKRKCLLILFRHNYSCTCLRSKQFANVNPIHINYRDICSKLNGRSILQVLKCSSETTMIIFIGGLTLANMARQTIRTVMSGMSSTFNNSSNYLNSINTLGLPVRLENFLLHDELKDVSICQIPAENAEYKSIYLIYI